MSKINWLSINGKPMGIVKTSRINRVKKSKDPRRYPYVLSQFVPLLIVEEITDIAHVEGAWVKEKVKCPICADPILVSESAEEGGIIYHASCLREVRELLSCL